MDWIKKSVLLGIVFFIAILLVKPIGVSTQYSVLSGIIHKAIDPKIIFEDPASDNKYASSIEYYNKDHGKLAEDIEKPWNYGFIFVLAIPLGGLIGSLFYKGNKSEKRRLIENRSILKEYLPSFLSGFLLLYGARMADGCTSGHMMSGIMQGSISGYVFAIVVFIIAIPTALITQKIRNQGVKN